MSTPSIDQTPPSAVNENPIQSEDSQMESQVAESQTITRYLSDGAADASLLSDIVLPNIDATDCPVSEGVNSEKSIEQTVQEKRAMEMVSDLEAAFAAAPTVQNSPASSVVVSLDEDESARPNIVQGGSSSSTARPRVQSASPKISPARTRSRSNKEKQSERRARAKVQLARRA